MMLELDFVDRQKSLGRENKEVHFRKRNICKRILARKLPSFFVC